MTLKEEFQTRNFNIYGQWLALLTLVFCFAFGIANLITTNILHIILAAVCLVFSFLIAFVEIKLLLRICPTSPQFDEKIRKINNAWARAGFYAVLSVALWLSLITGGSTLIVPAVFLDLTAICYLLAGLKHQEFIGSKSLGGPGIAQMIV